MVEGCGLLVPAGAGTQQGAQGGEHMKGHVSSYGSQFSCQALGDPVKIFGGAVLREIGVENEASASHQPQGTDVAQEA